MIDWINFARPRLNACDADSDEGSRNTIMPAGEEARRQEEQLAWQRRRSMTIDVLNIVAASLVGLVALGLITALFSGKIFRLRIGNLLSEPFSSGGGVVVL